MSKTYKAIETVYNGDRFRSRLEARWAVFFDCLKIDHRYELEGFDLDGIWYLPDFYLPEQKCWVEIKPDVPTEDEREKAIRLCIATQNPVVMLCGEVQRNESSFGFFPTHGLTRETMQNHVKQSEHTPKPLMWWITDVQCISLDQRSRPWGYDLGRGYGWGIAYWVKCSACKALGLEIDSILYPCGSTCVGAFGPNAHIIKDAYTTARQARFDGKGGIV